jgi:glycosyltransferase involved in cell wall biosynthesis
MQLSDKPLIFFLEPNGGHGGMVPYDVSLCTALSRYDLDLVWTTCDQTATTFQDCELWTPLENIYGQSSLFKRGLNYMRGLWRILARARHEAVNRPVIIHQQFVTLLPAEWLFMREAQRHGIPYVLTAHDLIPFSNKSLSKGLLPAFYRQCDLVMVHHRGAVVQLRNMHLGDDRVRVVPLGNHNDLCATGNASDRLRARAHLDVAPDTPLILFAGHVRHGKGLEYLIKAMPQVLHDMPEAQLLIVGRPHEDISLYEHLIDDLDSRGRVRVRWEYVPDTELHSYFLATDIVVLPYTHVYQSDVVMRSYAFSRPVVATTVAGLKEQVMDGATGFLVPPRDTSALASAILKLLKDPQLAHMMGERGHDWAAETGNWTDIARETIGMYRQAWSCRHAGSSILARQHC